MFKKFRLRVLEKKIDITNDLAQIAGMDYAEDQSPRNRAKLYTVNNDLVTLKNKRAKLLGVKSLYGELNEGNGYFDKIYEQLRYINENIHGDDINKLIDYSEFDKPHLAACALEGAINMGRQSKELGRLFQHPEVLIPIYRQAGELMISEGYDDEKEIESLKNKFLTADIDLGELESKGITLTVDVKINFKYPQGLTLSDGLDLVERDLEKLGNYLLTHPAGLDFILPHPDLIKDNKRMVEEIKHEAELSRYASYVMYARQF